jgi:hypothetical protein
MKLRFVLLLGLCGALGTACRGFAAGAAEGDVRSIVNTGHTGAVRGLEYDDRRGLFFSAGNDGTVRIWDAAAGSLERKLQVTQLGAELLAVNPVVSQVAVVVTDGTGSFYLSVWDWEEERQLFRVPLKEEPLFLRFSAMGSFIEYAESSWQSLKILRAEDGSAVPFHPEGFGMVGFAEMSRSEKTIMTYQLSGRIDYWDIETGRQTMDLPSVPYLSRIRISRDRRYIIGSTGSELVLVDTVTGAVRSRTGLTGAISFDISPNADEIACVSGADGRLDRWSFAGDTLVPLPGLPPLPVMPSLLCYGADTLFIADSAGGLHSISPGGEDSQFAPNALTRLDAIDAAPGLLAVGSPDWIRLLRTDLIDGAHSPTYIRSLLAQNPFHAPAGLALLPTQQLLAWRADRQPPALAMLDIPGVDKAESQGSFQGLPTGFLAPLTALRVTADSFLGVESDGTVRLTETSTGVSRFDQRIPGVFAAVAGSPTELIAGRNSAAAPGGSLLRVNTRTRETVAIKDRNAFTYSLLLDESGGGKPILYSVGIDASGATNLVRHSGPGFEQETLLGRVSEEDLDVSLALDPSTHVLYTTLGHDSISAWDGRQMKEIALQNTAPRRLVARSGILYTLNRDSTVSVLDGATGARLAEISLFADGEWCALLKDGRYAASLGGDAHVKVFQNGLPVQANEDYRLRTGR